MAAGLEVLDFPVPSPLSVLLLQAELPINFLRYRFLHMVEGYLQLGFSLTDESLKRIHIL